MATSRQQVLSSARVTRLAGFLQLADVQLPTESVPVTPAGLTRSGDL